MAPGNDPWWFRFLKTRLGVGVATLALTVATSFLITHPQVLAGWLGQGQPIQIQLPAQIQAPGLYSDDQVRRMISDAADAGAVKAINLVQPQINEITKRLDDMAYNPRPSSRLASAGR